MSGFSFRNNPNCWEGTDSRRIEQALAWAVQHHMPLEITRKKSSGTGRELWVIDRAILLPGECELRIIDCTIKLSDQCRDNFIRSANCGPGIRDPKPVRNIRISGVGNAVLEGADYPRATGDGAKILGVRTFGTDAGKPDERQKGDWRNIGILLADVQVFLLENVKIVNPHCWAVSLEHCSEGKIRNLTFDSANTGFFYGREAATLNQDGLDLRKGCHHIVIDGIYGHSGDDLVALTAIPSSPERCAGEIVSTEISAGASRGREDDIHDVEIRNVRGYTTGGHHIIRLLNSMGIRIYDIHIENLEDKTPDQAVRSRAALKIGDNNPAWGGVTPLGDTHHITVKNVVSRCKNAVLIAGSLAESVLENIENLNPEGELISYASGEENIRDVILRQQD